MKILVTGGAGFIGSHTIIELINSGHECISIDNFSNSEPFIFNRIEEITGVGVVNYDIDIANTKKLVGIFNNEEIDGVIHFAAYKAVGESMNQPAKYYRNNLNGLINILDACTIAEVNRIIFSSSCTVHGQPDSLPVTEDSPIKQAESVYGHTKQIGEEILKMFSSNKSLNTIALRYFNPVGAHHSGMIGELPKGKPSNLVPYITQSVAGLLGPLQVFGDDYDTHDGTGIRDYVHVSDIADAHVKAIEYLFRNGNKDKFEVFNLGSGNGYSVLDLVQAFESATGEKVKYNIVGRRPGDIEKVYANNTKARKILKWEPKRDLGEMMRSAWEWQRAQNHR